MWFETLTGFAEKSPEQVRANITVDGVELTSQVNGRRMICRDLETPSLAHQRRTKHNPLVADGKQAFIDCFEEMARDYPDKSIEFVRAVAEGDLVALHTHQTWPGNEQYVTMDFSVLTITAKLSSIRIRYKRCQMRQRMVIQLIDIIVKS